MLTRYHPGGLSDLQLFHAWKRMLVDGDLERGFGVELTVLSEFYATLRDPTVCWYAEDAAGIWALFWVQPTSLHAMYFHVWCAKEHRGTKAFLLASLEAFRLTFAEAPMLLVFTNQPHLEKTYARLGFLKGGELPQVWHGDTAYFWYLTKDALDATATKLEQRLTRPRLRVVGED